MQQEYYEVTEKDFEYTEEEMWNEAGTGMAEFEEQRQSEALESIFKANCFMDEFTSLPMHLMFFYWLKTFLCLCFNFTNGSYLSDSIEVVAFNEHSGHEGGTDWDCCWVERGIFKNWNVCVCGDSSY